MLEKIKPLGFIPESRAIKLYRNERGKLVAERYDRVTYLREILDIDFAQTTPVYVEADRFLSLLPFIQVMEDVDRNFLYIKLRNGAEYKLPYLDVEFQNILEAGVEPQFLMEGTFDLTILQKTALQNLVKPDMRCIYFSPNGGVSCDFLRGTVDKRLGSSEPFLLPPDMYNYIEAGEKGKLFKLGSKLFYMNEAGTHFIWAPQFEMEESEEQPWYQTISEKAEIPSPTRFSDIPATLEDSIKRLAYFGVDITFNTDKITSGENFEPVSIQSATGGVFTIEEVLSVLPYGKQIAFIQGSMYLMGNDYMIMVSEREEE